MNSKKFELSKREAESMEKLVHFVLEFEYHDYVDWCKREEPSGKSHVYYDADVLAGALLRWKGEENCCESQARELKEREEFFTDTSYDRKVL